MHYVQYDTTTKKVTGYHVLLRVPEPVPDDFVLVGDGDVTTVTTDWKYLSVDDTDPQNKLLSIPADLPTYKAQQDLMEQRIAEGDQIIAYLNDYLNLKAAEHGYRDYNEAMIFKNSGVVEFQKDGQAFSDCADAVWLYFKDAKKTFIVTGQPDLATVKVEHPKLETYIVP